MEKLPQDYVQVVRNTHERGIDGSRGCGAKQFPSLPSPDPPTSTFASHPAPHPVPRACVLNVSLMCNLLYHVINILPSNRLRRT